MKSSLFCLAFVLTYGLYSSPLVFAQTEDTTSAWRYLPLHVGNVWEYESWIEECLSIEFCETRLVGYERWSVDGEVEAGGRRYAVLSVRGFNVEGEGGGRRTILVRFDTLASRGVQRYADGYEEAWPGRIPCRLDAPFDTLVECDDGWEAFTSPRGEVEVRIDGEVKTRVAKDFYALLPWMSYAADVGLLTEGAAEFGGSWITLSYARVGALEYGTERFPVAAGAAAPESAFALAVYPNPSRGEATVRFVLDRPQRVMLAVFDVLGRRVLTADLGPQSAGEATHRLDAAALSAGLYVVWLTGDVGASATAQIVRH